MEKPLKIIKKEKYRFHCFIAFSLEVTIVSIVTVIILGNMFGNIKSSVFTYEGIEEKEIVLLSLQVCRCSISASVKYLFLYLLYLRLEQS